MNVKLDHELNTWWMCGVAFSLSLSFFVGKREILIGIPVEAPPTCPPHCYLIDALTGGERLNACIRLDIAEYYNSVDALSEEELSSFISAIHKPCEISYGGFIPNTILSYLQELYFTHTPQSRILDVRDVDYSTLNKE